jgi:RHS repeat-associated protein
MDQPVAITRLVFGIDSVAFPDLVVYPMYNWRGEPDDGGLFSNSSATYLYHGQTATIVWPARNAAAYRRYIAPGEAPSWFGSLTTLATTDAGTQYMRNRYYDPVAGRFTQEDPLGLAGGLNAYGFASGDPINYSDPFGLCVPKWLCDFSSSANAGYHYYLRTLGLESGSAVIPSGISSVRGFALGELTAGLVMALPTARAFPGGAAAAVDAETVGTRYMGAEEAAAVERDGTIPATNAQNEPRVIHYTTDAPTASAQEAMETYKLKQPPTHMCQFPLCNVQNSVPPTGTVAPGATQAATSLPIRAPNPPVPLRP